MKPSVIRLNRYHLFLALSLFLIFVPQALFGCSSVPNIRTYVAGSSCFGNAIDSAGNIWVANGGNGTPGTAAGDSNVTELSPSGRVIGTYVAGMVPIGIAIDKSGNVWVENYGNGTAGTTLTDGNVQEYMGAAKGPQYFPYSGPQWPGAE
jgi:hypothetical protein